MSTLEELSALVERVTAAHAPALYKQLYGVSNNSAPLRIPDWNSWRALPFLDKSLLQDTPIEKRIFIEWSEIRSIHASSGTSGRPPHFSPWVRLDGYEYRLRYHTFTRPALCSMPIHHQHEIFLDSYGVTPKLIVFDPRQPRASVALAKLAQVDSLFIFTGHLRLIGPEMERLGIGSKIKFIELAGESCSRALYRYAQRIFPHATIVSFYGATEVENPPITYPCRPFSEREPLELHHPRNGYYIELIHPETRELLPIAKGVEGEIVLTADISLPAKQSVAPLIRYRTGDMAHVVDTHCAEHNDWSFTMPGRAAMDFIKLPGGLLRSDELDRVIGMFQSELMSDSFELHCYDMDTSGTPLLRPVLHVDSLPSTDLGILAQSVSRELRVGPSLTYAQGVAEGRYLPLSCVKLNKTNMGAKRRRMIRHMGSVDNKA